MCALAALMTDASIPNRNAFMTVGDSGDGPKVTIEELDFYGLCTIRISDSPGLVYIVPCEVIEQGPEATWRYIGICSEFYDGACTGADI